MDGLNWLITHDFPRFKMNTIILLVKPNYCPWKCPVVTFGISSQSHEWQWKTAILNFSWFILKWEIILNYLYHSLSKYILSDHTTTRALRPFLIQDRLFKLTLARWMHSCIIWIATWIYWQKWKLRVKTVYYNCTHGTQYGGKLGVAQHNRSSPWRLSIADTSEATTVIHKSHRPAIMFWCRTDKILLSTY